MLNAVECCTVKVIKHTCSSRLSYWKNPSRHGTNRYWNLRWVISCSWHRLLILLQNCASSRPSSSVTSSRPVSFPLGSTPSQEEEATPTNICSTTPALGKEEERNRGEKSNQYHTTTASRALGHSTFNSVGTALSFWPSVFSHWQPWIYTITKSIILILESTYIVIQHELKAMTPPVYNDTRPFTQWKIWLIKRG